MTSYERRRPRTRGYSYNNKPEQTSFLVCLVFALLFSTATWVTLISVHNQQQVTHCEQGWQRACETL